MPTVTPKSAPDTASTVSSYGLYGEPDRTRILLKSKKPVRSIRSARSSSRSTYGLYGHLTVETVWSVWYRQCVVSGRNIVPCRRRTVHKHTRPCKWHATRSNRMQSGPVWCRGTARRPRTDLSMCMMVQTEWRARLITNGRLDTWMYSYIQTPQRYITTNQSSGLSAQQRSRSIPVFALVQFFGYFQEGCDFSVVVKNLANTL